MTEELRLADAVLVPSEFATKTYSPDIKVHTLPFGVDSKKFAPAPIDHDEYRVLFAGDNTLRKGLKYLVDAWQIVETRYWELWIKTNGCAPGKYGELKNIRVINEVPDMAELYNQVDVFCLPSIEEGQALVVWEAMACGLPCVVTKECGSLIEHDKHGIIIPAKDSKAIFLPLQDLVGSPEKRKRMGNAARKLAEEYPWERYGRGLAAVYKGVLG
jgi:glycosyltransferase involved in cell wall biosynthesis